MILDLSLPGMDGYELARRLRQHPQLAAVPLLALGDFFERAAKRFKA